jgi:hypothetical protein
MFKSISVETNYFVIKGFFFLLNFPFAKGHLWLNDKKGKWSELRKSERRKPKRTPKTT